MVLGEERAQCSRIGNRVAAPVIIEIGKDITPLVTPARHAPRPRLKRGVRVIASVGRGAVETEIHQRRGQAQWNLEGLHIMDAVGDLVAFQQTERCFDGPARVAKLDYMPVARR